MSPKSTRLCPSFILALSCFLFVFAHHGIDYAKNIGNASLAAEMLSETKTLFSSYLRASRNIMGGQEDSVQVEKVRADKRKEKEEFEDTGHRNLADYGKTIPLFMLGSGGRSDFTRTWDHTDLFVSFKQNIQPGESPWCVGQIFEQPRVMMQSSNYVSDKRTMSNHFSDVQDVMGVDAELEIAYGPIGEGKGDVSYFRDVSSTTNHVKYVVQIVHQAFALKAADNYELTPNPDLAKMAEAGNFNQIVEKYGAYFVDQIIYGAGLNIIYEFKSEDEIDMEEIRSSLTAAIQTGPLSGDFEVQFNKTTESESSKSSMEMTLSSTGLSNWYFSGTTSNFTETNVAIDEWKVLYSEQKARWAESFAAMKESYSDQSVSIEESFGTFGFDAIALTLLPIDSYLPEAMDKTSVEIAQARLMDCVDTLKEVQFMMARLGQQDEDFRRLTSYEENYMDKPFYYKWLQQKASVDIHFENKMKQIFDFRKSTIYEIVNYNTTLLTDMTSGLSPGERQFCDALTGSLAYRDYSLGGVPIENKVYRNAFWIGFAIDRNCAKENVCQMDDISRIQFVPAYRGHLKCDYTDAHNRESDSNYIVPEEIAIHVPEDLCTGVPTSVPTGSPSVVPSYEPSLSVRPSFSHSAFPSVSPSFKPSSSHSAFPSVSPSFEPSLS